MSRERLPRGAVRYATAVLATSSGTGFFLAFALIFYAELARVDLALVGVTLTVTALVALPAMFVVGGLVDRIGPRPILVAAATARGAAFIAFVAVPTYPMLVACALVLSLGARAEQASAPVLALRAAFDGQRSRWLALSRVAFNAGIGSGVLIASLVAMKGREGFQIIGLVAGALCILGAVLYRFVPLSGTTPVTNRLRPTVSSWHNRSFTRVAIGHSLLWMAAFAMESALPILVVKVLSLPPVLVGVLFAINTGVLVLIQLPASGIIDRWRAGRALAVGGLLYVVLYFCALVAGQGDATTAVVLLIIGMLVYTAGELIVSQSSLLLLTGIPLENEQGAYMAQSQVLVGLFTAFSPLLAATLMTDDLQWIFWGVLAAVSVVAAVLSWPVTLRVALTRKLEADLGDSRANLERNRLPYEQTIDLTGPK